MKKYICDACRQEFVAGWTEEDALAEAVENGWAGIPLSEMAQVCDGCYQKMAKQFGFTVQEKTNGA